MPNAEQMADGLSVLQRVARRAAGLAEGDEPGLKRQQDAAMPAIEQYADGLGLEYVLAANGSSLEHDQSVRIDELEELLTAAGVDSRAGDSGDTD